jgi:hypothetical protein
MPHDPTRESMREALRAWGLASVNRWCYSRGDRSIHVLEQARDMAPGTKERALRDLVARDGTARRQLMAAGAGVKGMDIVPMWACEPIRAANDADHPHERAEIAVDQGIPAELMWVDRAVGQLERQFPLRALVVRTEYTVSGSQAVKAHMVEDMYGGRFSVWMYRRELERAIEWISMKGEPDEPEEYVA